MNTLKDNFGKIKKIIFLIEDSLLVIVLGALILLSFSQIVLRSFFSTGLFWGESALRYLVLWIALLGAMVATREYNHINIDVVSKYASDKIKYSIRIITDLFTAVVTAVLTYYSVIFIKNDMASNMKAFGSVPSWVAGLILPVAFCVICVRYIFHLFTHLKKSITGGDDNKNKGVL
jgi:TRAP-type C4-dicarboxylate transport system permease small subunit